MKKILAVETIGSGGGASPGAGGVYKLDELIEPDVVSRLGQRDFARLAISLYLKRAAERIWFAIIEREDDWGKLSHNIPNSLKRVMTLLPDLEDFVALANEAQIGILSNYTFETKVKGLDFKLEDLLGKDLFECLDVRQRSALMDIGKTIQGRISGFIKRDRAPSDKSVVCLYERVVPYDNGAHLAPEVPSDGRWVLSRWREDIDLETGIATYTWLDAPDVALMNSYKDWTENRLKVARGSGMTWAEYSRL